MTVLSREYCHLCDEFLHALEPFKQRYDLDIRVVDIDRHPELLEKWNDKVPVLIDGDLEICHHFLDTGAVDARLSRMK